MSGTLGNGRALRRELLDLAWPVILANLLQVLTTTVDLIMVGRLSVASIAAVGVGGNLVFFAFTVIIGISAGTIALVARAVGAKNPREADHFLYQSLVGGVLLSLPLVLLGLTIPDLIVRPFSPSLEVERLAAEYTAPIFLSMPFLFVITLGTAALRAAGDTKTPLIIGVLENVVNVVLNYGLVYGNLGMPPLGVRGSGTATAIAYLVGAVMYLALFASRRLRVGLRRERPFVNGVTMRRILRVGLPAAAEQFAFQIGLLVWILMVVGFGEAAVAAHQIGLRVQSFAFMPALGLSVAASALTGQNLGAGDPHRAERSAREATKMALLIMGLVGLLNFVFAPWIALAFSEAGQTVDLSVLFIRLHATSIPAVGVFFSLSGSLRGAGDTRWPFYASTFGTYAIRLPVSLLLGYTLGLGIAGVWIGLPVEYYVRAAVIVPRFTGGAWKTMAV